MQPRIVHRIIHPFLSLLQPSLNLQIVRMNVALLLVRIVELVSTDTMTTCVYVLTVTMERTAKLVRVIIQPYEMSVGERKLENDFFLYSIESQQSFLILEN